MNPTSQQLNRAKDIVEETLKEFPEARNNDLLLCLMVWQKKQQIKCFIPFDKLNEMLSPETLRRCRQKLQNEEGKYPPTNFEVLKRRQMREKAMKAWAVQGV